MMRIAGLLCALALALPAGSRAEAQDAPKPIGPFVVDVRVTVPGFAQNQQLADSRGLAVADLPGSGLGLDLGAQVYFFKWKAVTFGAGGQLTLARAHSSQQVQDGVIIASAVTERYTTIAPQISFNFGTGAGWSYLSGGVGPSVWSVVADGTTALPADDERVISFNYGGGARWFAKPHVAFTFDVRFYDIYPGSPEFGFPGSPRTRMLIFGAGVSVK
jgi:hypothetical protein